MATFAAANVVIGFVTAVFVVLYCCANVSIHAGRADVVVATALNIVVAVVTAPFVAVVAASVLGVDVVDVVASA